MIDPIATITHSLKHFYRARTSVIALIAAGGLVGCAAPPAGLYSEPTERSYARYAPPERGWRDAQRSGRNAATVAPSPRMAATNTHQRIGKPYTIFGVRYTPARDDNYRKQGIASWYGPKFHGRPTANGEVFDQNLLSAAHPTLPLPSLVRVTNLENGKSLVVRVNDRGPFAHNRIIDMSRAAAEVLGFEHQGTAQVEVKYVGPAEAGDRAANPNVRAQPQTASAPRRRTRAYAGEPSSQTQTVRLATRTESRNAARQTDRYGQRPSTGSRYQTPGPNQRNDQRNDQSTAGIFIQAGAFQDANRARSAQRVVRRAGRSQIDTVTVGGQRFHRVLVGPFASTGEAERAHRTVAERGFADAKIIQR